MAKNKAQPTPSPFDRFQDNVILKAVPESVTSEDTLDMAEAPAQEAAPDAPAVVTEVAPTPPLGAYNYGARALCSGEAVPGDYRADADPDLVRSLELFERVVAGGLLSYSAYDAYNAVVDIIFRLRNRVCEPTPQAPPLVSTT